MPKSKKRYVKRVLAQRRREKRARIIGKICYVFQCFVAMVLFEAMMIAFVLAA